MLVIKGSGGEGKSQIGNVLSKLFGAYARTAALGRFQKTDLPAPTWSNVLLMIDDDMRLEALRQTNYVKSIVTAKSKMDLGTQGQAELSGLDDGAHHGVFQRRSDVAVRPERRILPSAADPDHQAKAA